MVRAECTREGQAIFCRFGPLREAKYPTSLDESICGRLQVRSPEWRKANELGRWSMEMMGYPLGLIYTTVGHSIRT
jgi:hypothetical protein